MIQTKSSPYKCTRVRLAALNENFGAVEVDLPIAILRRLEKTAQRHRWPIDMLLSATLGVAAVHVECLLKEAFAGARRSRRLAARGQVKR